MIENSEVAIFSDLHLGIYGNSPDWHNIAINWADWIVVELKKKKIKDILFLGDFFHNRSEISVQTLDVSADILNKFKDFNIIMIVGNHDAYYKNRSDVHSLRIFQGYDNITIVDSSLVVQCFGKKLEFVSWNNELQPFKVDYVFGHFEIQSFKMNNFKVCDHGLTAMDFLGSKTDTVFSGHFHNRNTGKYNEGSIHYIGNTFPMDFSDAENIKGYHILELKTGKLDFFENSVSPKFKKIVLSKIKTVKEDDIKGNIIKLIVDITVDDAKLDKFKLYLNKFKPFRIETEFNVVSIANNSEEEIDSVEIVDMFDEFLGQMKFDEDKTERIKTILNNLYEKNKV